MQCASCDAKITDHAAETGVCPKCGMPLPGSGGTMRFNSEMFADLANVSSQAVAVSDRSLEQKLGERTVGLIEPEAPPAADAASSTGDSLPPPAPSTAPPTAPKSIDETCTESLPSAPEPSEITECQEADINRTIESHKLTPDQYDEYGATLLEVSEVSATVSPDALLDSNRTSATLPGSGESDSALRSQSDTTLFGPETRLVIQSRQLAAPDQNGQARKSEARQDYELVEVIGRGGMGLVYSARQTSVDREVAVKMIWPDHAQDPSARENFLSEAVITGELDHPNIVPIHDVGKDAGNALFYSMKRVRGTPWQDVIAVGSLAENLRILMSVADAVAFAHSRGVVHRDLKPENVMLGGFGEVMVMDWGLAIVTPEFRKSESVARAVSAGCTPSYAAPELVTGPISAIGPHSDVYLLGAILYKVVTGKPPHLARTPQECCRVAARNQIHPTTQTGELVEIARQAMATKPKDRFAGVQAFQDAIRSYQSHSESLVLSARAAEDLQQARDSGKYEDFARAMFGYQEAVKLWEGNDAARTGLAVARLAYAESALGKQDFDLGLTLIDAEDPAQRPVAERLRAGQAERNQRRRRLQLMYRTAIAMAAVIFVGGSIGMYLINREKETAQRETIAADEQRAAAIKAQKAEKAERENAVREQQLAVQAKGEAEAAKEAAVESEQTAQEQRTQALLEKKRADAARLAAVRSQQAQAFEAYVAQIGLASEQINTNAFDGALSVLQDQAQSPYRGWEWYRLEYLARQGQATSAHFKSEVEAVALDSTGERIAVGLRDGRVLIGRVADLADLTGQAGGHTTMINHGAAVLAVGFSADDRLLVTAGESGTLALWNAADGTPVGPKFTGHDPHKSIRRARIVDAGGRRWLLTASADRTAQLWDLSKSPQEWTSGAVQILRGHHLQVWDAVMSGDGQKIVTVGEDGRAVVWGISKAEGRFVPARTPVDPLGNSRPRVFTGHEGAIYTAAFSPDGKLVATAGLDQRVLIWNPERVVEDDLKERMAALGDPLRVKQKLTEAIVLEGHTEPVHSVTFSRDGKYLLSGSDDNTVRIWPWNGDLHDVTIMRGHGGWVRSCVFAPLPNETGDWTVISGSHDRQIKQWNVAGYAEVRALRVDRLADHGDAVLAAAFNPRGDRIVTASRDHMARVWQLSPGKFVQAVVADRPLKLFEGHDFSATAARYLGDGRRIVTSGIDGQVCLWDKDTGAQLARLPGTGLAAAIAVSPDDAWILTGSSTPVVKLWKVDDVIADYASGRESKPVHEFEGHRAQVRVVAFAPDGSGRFYSGDEAGTGRLWDLNDRRQPPRELDHHTLRINAAAFLPDGRQIATAADDGFVYICDVATGAIRSTLNHRSNSESVVALGLTPDGSRMITVGEPASENESFVIFDWNVKTGQLARSAALERGLTVFGLSVAPGNQIPGALLAIGRRSDGKTELRGWNLSTWQEQRATDDRHLLDDPVLAREHATIWSAVWSRDGQEVLTVGGNEAQIWQLNGRRATTHLGPHRAVAAVNFSNDGRFVVTGSWDESFKLWTIAEGISRSLCRVSVPAGGAVNSAAFSPVGGSFQILTAHDDGTARLWNWDPRQPDQAPTSLRVFAHGRSVNSAVYSHDGNRVLTLCADGVARVWDPAADARQPLLELAGRHSGAVLCGAFSSDGKWIATGGEDKQIVLWNAITGAPALEAPLQGHSAAITSLAFSDTGERLLTGSRDSTAKLWDLRIMQPDDETDRDPIPVGTLSVDDTFSLEAEHPVDDRLRGKELLTLRGHSAEITSVAFSPDGRFVLTASLDSSAILWLTNKP